MSGTKTILVVEDEQDVQTYLAALFEDNGYRTIRAGDGVKALELARTEKPDLITLDMAMPEQSGVRTFRQYKADPELSRIPVVIITGVGEDMQTFFAKLKGFSKPEGFMAKPVDPGKLLKMVEALLAA
ncbi:MAG: response regulator [Proteobacteria bacterium]|nr:response regulator [Pseudomonadota bacterium]